MAKTSPPAVAELSKKNHHSSPQAQVAADSKHGSFAHEESSKKKDLPSPQAKVAAVTKRASFGQGMVWKKKDPSSPKAKAAVDSKSTSFAYEESSKKKDHPSPQAKGAAVKKQAWVWKKKDSSSPQAKDAAESKHASFAHEESSKKTDLPSPQAKAAADSKSASFAHEESSKKTDLLSPQAKVAAVTNKTVPKSAPVVGEGVSKKKNTPSLPKVSPRPLPKEMLSGTKNNLSNGNPFGLKPFPTPLPKKTASPKLAKTQPPPGGSLNGAHLEKVKKKAIEKAANKSLVWHAINEVPSNSNNNRVPNAVVSDNISEDSREFPSQRSTATADETFTVTFEVPKKRRRGKETGCGCPRFEWLEMLHIW